MEEQKGKSKDRKVLEEIGGVEQEKNTRKKRRGDIRGDKREKGDGRQRRR